MKSFRLKAIIVTCMALVLSALVLPTAAQGFSGSGTGTSIDPFIVTSCAQFVEVDDDLEASYLLDRDLDCTSTGADLATQNDYFEGSFDGGGFSITVDIVNDSDSMGLFGYADGADFSNLEIYGTVDGAWRAGGLVGHLQGNSTITNVISHVDVTGGKYIGGLVGATDTGTIEISYSGATGNVTGDGLEGQIGGFIGSAVNGVSIERSYATGDVTAVTSEEVGGFVGINNGFIFESFALGDVVGDDIAGGFVGEEGNATFNSYARGDVSGDDKIGGFVGYRDCGDNYDSYSTGSATSDGGDEGGFIGYDDCGVAENLFWDTETSGNATSDVGTGKTTAEMKNIATFTDTNTVGLDVAWNFDDVWTIDGVTNDGYPYHGWYTPEEAPATTATTTDTPTGNPVTITWDSSCDLSLFEVKAESVNATQDIAFEYPNGLVNFTLASCADPEVNITLLYQNVDNAAFVLRKYTPATSAYTTVEGAVLEATTVDGAPAVQATYTIVDNGPLDTDPTVGIISDPVGIAQATLGAPATGGGGTAQ